MFNNFKTFILDTIIKIDKKKIIIIYFFYIGFIILCSGIYGYLLNVRHEIYDTNFNIIFNNISFNHGDLIFNLINKGEFYTNFYRDINFYLAKTPALPFFIFFLSLFSKNFFFIIIFKNLIIYSFYFYFTYKNLYTQNVKIIIWLLILVVPIIIPYNFSVSLNFFYEDSLIAILLPLLFLFLLSNYKYKYFLIGVIIFSLYFIKTSMFFIVVVIPTLIFFFEKKPSKYLPIIFSLSAILIWGYYGFFKTGRFAFLNTSSSINTKVLAYVLNDNFHIYYPNKSVDLIPIDYNPPDNINDEWTYYDFYKEKNKQYLKKNINRYLKDIFIKLKFIFFGVNRDGSFPDKNGNYDNSIRFSLILSKPLFIISIFFSFFFLFRNLKKFSLIKNEIYFLLLVLLNLLPHLSVWATSKHLVAISNISMIYLIFYFIRRKKR